MMSIRRKLLVSVLSVLTIATIAIGLATYWGIRNELDELYDANMKQLAVTAAGMVSETETVTHSPAYSDQWPKGEQIFLIQIWDGERLLYSTHPIADLPLQATEGFGHIFFQDKKWVYYQEEIEGKTIQVSQKLKERRDVIREVYNVLIIPTAIQFPIVFVLMWFLISYGFRPLTRVSKLIEERSASFMQPIPIGSVPTEIHTLVVALNDLLERLHTALKIQKQFTADAAHELRTPLTVVRLQLDLLKRSQDENERLEAVLSLERGVTRSIHLVQQLLELARQEPENIQAEFAKVDLSESAKEIIQEYDTLAHAKSITIRSDLKECYATGDQSAFSIMIGNILGNAVAYTPEHGIIEVRSFMKDGRAVIQIADNGIGISPKDRERIFDRFYRVTGSHIAGSGLGLSIVKAIAEKHKVKIDICEGIGGQGTCFDLIFEP